jgi:hypothetical protein
VNIAVHIRAVTETDGIFRRIGGSSQPRLDEDVPIAVVRELGSPTQSIRHSRRDGRPSQSGPELAAGADSRRPGISG